MKAEEMPAKSKEFKFANRFRETSWQQLEEGTLKVPRTVAI